MAKPKEQESGTDIERAASMATVRASIRSIDELKELVLRGKDEITVDPAEVEQRIFDRMMSATTPEEVLGASSTTKADDVLGQNITVHGVNFLESDQKDGLGIFAVIDGTIGKERHAITCGARTIVAQLMKFDFEGWFPVVVKINKSTKPTSNGYYPMELVPGDPIEEAF